VYAILISFKTFCLALIQMKLNCLKKLKKEKFSGEIFICVLVGTGERNDGSASGAPCENRVDSPSSRGVERGYHTQACQNNRTLRC
jgi:hypothetical protein